MTTTNTNILALSSKPNFPSPFKLHHQNQHNDPPHKNSSNNLLNQNHGHMTHITIDQTKQIHAHMLKTQFKSTLQIHSNTFQLPSSHFTGYNFLITSYNKNNQPICALTIYAQLRSVGIELDCYTIPSLLKSCAQIKTSRLGREIHGYTLKNGLSSDVFVGNVLMLMYSQCEFAGSARLVFDKMPERDVVSWSTLIRAYSRRRMFDEAVGVIEEMQYNLVKPSEIAMISMVNVFAGIAKIELSKSIHAYVIKNSNINHLSANLTTSLIDMYAKSGHLALARRLFDDLVEKGVVSYTAMIAGYISCDTLEEGVKLFTEMLTQGIYPNEVTLLSLITGCGLIGALDIGKQLHSYALRNGFSMTMALATSLIDMYGKCCETGSAKAVFDSMETRDIMTWTALISAYARGQCVDEAIDLFILMRNNGLNPNQVTMVTLISLCSEAGALNLGKWLHAYIDRYQIDLDYVLKTALIDMYAKCGDIASGYKLFVETMNRDICMWNSMITGFGMHGFGQEALELFTEMENSGIKPNDVTFIGLLHACSHAGMVTEGKRVFENMVSTYCLVPKIEHYGCMVDLLGRAAMLNEAYEMIQSMPMKPNAIIWSALVAACKVHKNHKLGELAVRKLLEIDPGNCGYNVLMSNIYATGKRWTDVTSVRATMENKGMKKKPGLSCIEANGSVHKFVSGGKRHPQFEEINDMLDEMTRKLWETGYKPETSAVLLNVGEEEREKSLKYHSEKIAMAFGLISTASGTPIRIVKNLRVCDDCHTATKLLSKIYGRLIIVRDRNRFHHFVNGLCSCGDYW